MSGRKQQVPKVRRSSWVVCRSCRDRTRPEWLDASGNCGKCRKDPAREWLRKR